MERIARIAPSVRLELQIQELLTQGLSEGSEHLTQLGRLGARLVLQRAVDENRLYFGIDSTALVQEAFTPRDGVITRIEVLGGREVLKRTRQGLAGTRGAIWRRLRHTTLTM